MAASTPALAATTNVEQEVVVLDRVLHRLVVTDDSKLSQVLHKLLPKLLRKLNEAPAVRSKVIDVLSHVSKRTRPNPAIVLPCSEILAVCGEVPPTSFSFNFSLTFLEMGVPRLPPADQGAVAAEIACGISRLQRYSSSQNILLNLLLVVLEHLPLHSDSGGNGTESAAASPTGRELSAEDSAVVCDWLLDVALYPGILTHEGSAYHGLSPAGLARLTTREKTWPPELLVRRKLAVVRALKSDLFAPAAKVTPALAAACSTHHEVVKMAEDLLKSLSSSDRTGALQRSAAVAFDILVLVLGGTQAAPTPMATGPAATGGSKAAPVALSSARLPASPLLAVKALAWLEAECQEGTAARVPEAVRVSFFALFTGVGTGGAGGGASAPRAPGAAHQDRANEARFRAAGARLAAFVASRCDVAILPVVGPLLLQAVQRVLIMNAAPASAASSTSADRGSGVSGNSSEAPSAGASLLIQTQHAAMLEACYETVASLAVRRPAFFEGDTSVPRLLISELSAKEPALRVKISAALGALKGAYRVAGGVKLTSELWSLLWSAAASAEYRARLCAVEWACELFDFSDVAARRLCISLCDDKVMAVRSAASRGLHLRPPTSAAAPNGSTSTTTKTSSTYPTFAAFVLGALCDDAAPAVVRGGGSAPASFKEFTPAALARALDFALECRRAHPHDDTIINNSSSDAMAEVTERKAESEEEAVSVFVSLIEATLEIAPSAAGGQHGHAQTVLLHRSAAMALQKLVVGDSPADGSEGEADGTGRVIASAPAVGVAKNLAFRGPWLQQWLGHEASMEIREAFAEVTGAAAVFMDPDAELVPLLRALGLKLKTCTMAGAVGFSNRAVSTAHGAACAVGAILARLAAATVSDDSSPGARAWADLSVDAIPTALSSVAAAIGHPVSLLHVAACSAIGRVGAAASLPLPSSADDGIPTSGSGEARVSTIAAVFERLWTACKLGETTDASRRAEAAAEALGSCCRGSGNRKAESGASDGETTAEMERSMRVRKTLKVLFDMAKNQKEEELQFAVGGAVADVARSGPLFVPSGSALESMRASARAARREMEEAAVGGKDGHNEAGEGGVATVDALDYVLYQVLYVLLDDHSPHVSGAAAVYLLAVVHRCSEHPLLAAYLPDIQAAFIRKLTVRSEFVQEVAGKGLALGYLVAGRDAKQGLVDSLVDALSIGRRRLAGTGGSGGAVDVHGGTHAEAALSEAGTGAYGEMCAVANDVGRPDLIYSFLSVASHHPAWTTRRGASYGTGTMINQVSAGAFGAQLDRIVPRLFRYRFDPSAKTRATMEQLWRSVLGGGGGGDFSIREQEVIRTNLSAIISELLRALGERKWRDRQSACAALADVLRGRGWDQIGPHLEKLWIMADRALDDIKESVAEAAVDFAKTLANISVRLCDPYTFVPPNDVSAEAAAAASARSDAAGQGSDALREEAGDVRRTIGTMIEDLRTTEAEARARGEDGMSLPGGLLSAQGRAAAADQVLRQAAEGGAGTATAEDGGVGRVLGGRRNGPSVADILRPGRAGTERTGPPPSAEAREAAAAAISVTLPWLLRKGLLSRCKASQGLAMRTLRRLVMVCDKDSLMPHLAELVATLIEGLSALEPQALQYMQFHAETQLEMTQDQMERLRLSVSRAGPLQDALDQCYRHLDGPGVVEELMPRLLGLLRSGTGLATRSASAYLVLSLCERAPTETRKFSLKLLPTLTNAALSERSSTLRRTYSSALSSVARLAPAVGVSRLANRLAQLFREADPDFDKRQRRTLAMLLGDLCRRAGDQLGAGADGGKSGDCVGDDINFNASGWAQVLPVAYVARHDPDKPVADAFEEAWQEGLTQLQLGAAGIGEASRVRTAKDAVLLMLPAVLTELSAAISSVSRVTKRQGCSGLKDLSSTLGKALGEASSGRRLIRRVLSQMPGRTWEGKEVLLEAVVALCKAGKGSAISLEPFVWGEEASGEASVESSGGGPRGVKRGRSEELLGDAQDETEAEEEEDDEQEAAPGEAKPCPGVGAPDKGNDEDATEGAHRAVSVASGSAAARRGDDCDGAKKAPGAGTPGSDEGSADDGTKNADGTEADFVYQDKLGFAENVTAVDATGGDRAPVVAAVAGSVQQSPRVAATSGEERTPLYEEDDSAVPFGDVVALMLAQLQRKNIKFRRAAAVSLAILLTAFPECCVYEMVAPSLITLVGLAGPPGDSRGDGKEDPIMQARAVSCIAAAWPHLPPSQSSASNREAVVQIQRTHAESLTCALSGAIQRKVWSVRVPILNALAAVVGRSYARPAGGIMEDVGGSKVASVVTGALLANVVRAVEVGAEDVKYSQVRAAANAVVVAMTSRKELRLALTPHKEGLMAIARSGAGDPEPKVAVEGSKAAQILAWWP